jgi:2-polyprenyl-3-methyl-5-hydroxy-6-metoxy-1,4-benzoquinol methylase
MTGRWNHNIHYHPVILDAIPPHCLRVLDVGCGEGTLARQLRATVPEVTAIDRDQPSIDLARTQHSADPNDGDPIDYVLGDFLTHPFTSNSFDAIVCVAALHHMDATTALGRMRDLLRPGGTLAIVGLARSRWPVDLPVQLAAIAARAIFRRTRTYWHNPSPTLWPPPETYASMRRLAHRELPGVRYRRHLLCYSLIWTKPAAGDDLPSTAEN